MRKEREGKEKSRAKEGETGSGKERKGVWKGDVHSFTARSRGAHARRVPLTGAARGEEARSRVGPEDLSRQAAAQECR
jgi:hypothetical protein